MPYKFETDHIPLPEGKDRRKKLSDEDRLAIKENIEGKSQRALARQYGVSRRLVGFIVNPESLAKNLEARKARGGWRQYYDKDTWPETMKEHRTYKQKTLLSEAKND